MLSLAPPTLLASRRFAEATGWGERRQALGLAFQGLWRIVEMDEWGEAARDLVEPAFVRFDGQDGEMRFIAMAAWLDVRYGARNGAPIAEFSWEGVEEGDQRCGRGWVEVGTAGRLVGHFFIHNGDEAGFVCKRW